VKIWDFLQQYPTYGDNGNIYTDYLTNWGSIILLVHFITGLSYILVCMCSQSIKENVVEYWLGRWFFVTVELSVSTAVTITASYWLLLGGDDEYQYKFMNVHEHVMNTVLALTSFLLVKRAFTWWHVIFMWIFGVFYGLQNYLSYLGMPSRNNIYGLINWEDLHQFDEKYMGTLEVMSIITFGALTVFYYLALLIDYGKYRLVNRFSTKVEDTAPPNDPFKESDEDENSNPYTIPL